MSREGWALVCPFCREFSFTPGQSAPTECPLCWVPLTPDAVRNAQENADRLGMSAEGSRAGTAGGEHSAQMDALRQFCHAVGRLLAAVFLALGGRRAWSRATARERATRPRGR